MFVFVFGGGSMSKGLKILKGPRKDLLLLVTLTLFSHFSSFFFYKLLFFSIFYINILCKILFFFFLFFFSLKFEWIFFFFFLNNQKFMSLKFLKRYIYFRFWTIKRKICFLSLFLLLNYGELFSKSLKKKNDFFFLKFKNKKQTLYKFLRRKHFFFGFKT